MSTVPWLSWLSGSRPGTAGPFSSLGGTLEHFCFAFAPENLLVICDLPDSEAAAAFTPAIDNSGAATGHVTALLSPEEMDRAIARSPACRAPGGC